MGLFPSTFTHGQLEIKSPLWSQAWDSIPLVRLEGTGAFYFCSPTDLHRGHLMNPWEELIIRSNQWLFLEHSHVLGQVLVADRRYRNK